MYLINNPSYLTLYGRYEEKIRSQQKHIRSYFEMKKFNSLMVKYIALIKSDNKQ